MARSYCLALMVIVACVGFSHRANAQWAVIDVGAIAQLLQEVQQMEQMIQTAQNQLNQAHQEYQSITGTRGMQNLLPGVNWNYLPSSFAQVSSALSSNINRQISTNAVLTPTQVAALSPAEQQQLNAARSNAALLQTSSQQAYATASARFASLQTLITAIGSATDQKAVLDLQARAQAEQGLLQNDATKLQLLYQAAQAEEWARRQRASEQLVTSVGNLRTLSPLQLR
jgi:type IV secretion system protein VirB5